MRSGKLGDAFFPRLENRKGGSSLCCSNWALLYQKDFRAPAGRVESQWHTQSFLEAGQELIISTTCAPYLPAE